MAEIALTQMLTAREHRAQTQARLLERRLKAAGTDWLHRELQYAPTREEAYYAVPMEISALKRLLVEIEETGPSGRLLDLDLLDVHGHPVSRESLGLHQRRCLLCNQPAKLCARSRRTPSCLPF